MLLNDLQSLDDADRLDKDENITIHDNIGDYNIIPSAYRWGVRETIFIIKPFAPYKSYNMVLVICEMFQVDYNGQPQRNIRHFIGRYIKDGDNYCIVNLNLAACLNNEPLVILENGSVEHRIIGVVKDVLFKWDNS